MHFKGRKSGKPYTMSPTYQKGKFLLPSFFTTLSLFFGFYSILNSIEGNFAMAAWFILLSTLCDGLDGTVARMTNTTSKFGLEYDSLCDLVSFGVAPAILYFLWALYPDNLLIIEPYHMKTGAMVAFIFLACGALRLARFNVFSEVRDPGFFQGIPITAAAGISAAFVLWHFRNDNLGIHPNGLHILIFALILAFLMVSSIKYPNHKHKVLTNRNKPFESTLIFIILLAVVAIKVKTMLFPISLIYLILGPIITIIIFIKQKRNKKVDTTISNNKEDIE